MDRSLLIDQAKYILGLLPASRAVEIAEQAVLQGCTDKAVLQLASLSKAQATWEESDELFQKMLFGMGLHPLSRSEAQIVLARHLAEQYVLGTLSTGSFLDRINGLAGWGHDNGAGRNPVLADHLHTLDFLNSMYSEAAVSPARKAAACEKEIREACQKMLAELPGDS